MVECILIFVILHGSTITRMYLISKIIRPTKLSDGSSTSFLADLTADVYFFIFFQISITIVFPEVTRKQRGKKRSSTLFVVCCLLFVVCCLVVAPVVRQPEGAGRPGGVSGYR